MFYNFLRIYKNDVYNGSWSNLKRVPWYEWLIGILAILFLIAAGVVTLVDARLLAVFMTVSILCIITFFISDSKRINKEREKIFSRYKENKLAPLVQMLKDEKFQLYGLAQIDWLISCCELEINKSNKKSDFGDYFLRYIFPLLTLLYGFLIKQSTVSDIAVLSMVIPLVLITSYLLGKTLLPVYQTLINPDIDAIVFLKSELEYIKTTI